MISPAISSVTAWSLAVVLAAQSLSRLAKLRPMERGLPAARHIQWYRTLGLEILCSSYQNNTDTSTSHIQHSTILSNTSVFIVTTEYYFKKWVCCCSGVCVCVNDTKWDLFSLSSRNQRELGRAILSEHILEKQLHHHITP